MEKVAHANNTRFILFTLCIISTTIILYSPISNTATRTDAFFTLAGVSSGCNITANDLDFGEYDPLQTIEHEGKTTVNIHCVDGINFSVGINQGLHPNATVYNRKMQQQNGYYSLAYKIFIDAEHTLNWGNTIDLDVVNGTSSAILNVYGVILPKQDVPKGYYSDTLIATITF